MVTLKSKRAYDPAGPDDGWRVYIDRLWPRGLSHDTFHYDQWYKTISPSTTLRQWFHADPDNRWQEFIEKYTLELKANPDFTQMVTDLASHPVVTLLYSSHDRIHDNAVVLIHTLLTLYPTLFRRP